MAEDKGEPDVIFTPIERFERAVDASKKATHYAHRGKDNASLFYLCDAITELAEGLLLKEIE